MHFLGVPKTFIFSLNMDINRLYKSARLPVIRVCEKNQEVLSTLRSV